jgi:pimeloyl-ACP methyl ester carboxylesterase
MPIIGLNDVDLWYEAAGSGEPLVLIPGFASGAWSWTWQTEELSRDFQVITFDPRGVSRSRLQNGAAVSIRAIADDVAELLDHLGIGAAHILGISFGGFVVQEFALAHPDRLKTLVLASTSFGGPNHVAPSMEVLAAFTSVEGLNSAERIRHYFGTAFSADFAAREAKTVDRFCRLREENEVPRDVYLQQLQSAMAFNAEERLAAMTAAALVITGDDDAVVPPQNSKNLVDRLPNAMLETIHGGGHLAFVEKAGEFNSRVTAFLGGAKRSPAHARRNPS